MSLNSFCCLHHPLSFLLLSPDIFIHTMPEGLTPPEGKNKKQNKNAASEKNLIYDINCFLSLLHQPGMCGWGSRKLTWVALGIGSATIKSWRPTSGTWGAPRPARVPTVPTYLHPTHQPGVLANYLCTSCHHKFLCVYYTP